MPKHIDKIPYLGILKKSLTLTWQNKYLWWFGLFLSFGSASLNGSGDFGDIGNNKNNEFGRQISEFVSQNPSLFAAITGGVIAILLALFIISFIARGGAIKCIDKILKSELANFHQGIREGKKYFWRLCLQSAIIGALVLGSLIVLAVPVFFLFATHANILGFILAFFAFLIFIPIIILASYLMNFGNIYIVLGDLSALASYRGILRSISKL